MSRDPKPDGQEFPPETWPPPRRRPGWGAAFGLALLWSGLWTDLVFLLEAATKPLIAMFICVASLYIGTPAMGIAAGVVHRSWKVAVLVALLVLSGDAATCPRITPVVGWK